MIIGVWNCRGISMIIEVVKVSEVTNDGKEYVNAGLFYSKDGKEFSDVHDVNSVFNKSEFVDVNDTSKNLNNKFFRFMFKIKLKDNIMDIILNRLRGLGEKVTYAELQRFLILLENDDLIKLLGSRGNSLSDLKRSFTVNQYIGELRQRYMENDSPDEDVIINSDRYHLVKSLDSTIRHMNNGSIYNIRVYVQGDNKECVLAVYYNDYVTDVMYVACSRVTLGLSCLVHKMIKNNNNAMRGL